MDSTSNIATVSLIRVFPENYPTAIQTIPLSIADASVANFSSCTALWFFRKPVSPQLSHLESSLRKTLESYPQWCGKLSKVQYQPERDHNTRYGRLQISWGSETDPGVEFCIAKSTRSLNDFLPKERPNIWDASQLLSQEFFPTLNPTRSLDKELPCIAVQITTLACGGLVLVIRMHHSLADAQTLSLFAHDWSANARNIAPNSDPTFSPQDLDSRAAGDIDLPTPNAALIAKSRSLPIERFDWYVSTPFSPHPPHVTAPPPELQSSTYPPGTPLPWTEWDMTIPVSHTMLHFPHSAIQSMWAAVTVPGAGISKHDALVAHVWALINRARGNDDDELVHLDYTIGLRGRVSPQLPPGFLGSPIIQTDICSRGREACSSVAVTASRIRATLNEFDGDGVAAVLHDMCYQDSAQRIWQAFLGRRHVICTTWVGTRLHECDFGLEEVGFVLGFMPFNDGIVQIIEGGMGNHWGDSGVDVNVYLEEGAAKRLRDDEWLKALLEESV